MFNIRQSPRTSRLSRTNGLVEIQNENIGTYKRLFLTPLRNGHFWTIFCLCSQYSTTVTYTCSLYQINFPTQLRFPLKFWRVLSRKILRESTAEHSSDLPPQSHDEPTDLNPFILIILLKQISIVFLDIETSMLHFVWEIPKLWKSLMKFFNRRWKQI